ncbi:MAG: hypothetical protein ACRCW6_02760 [Mycoplasmoidaceae bacterium]
MKKKLFLINGDQTENKKNFSLLCSKILTKKKNKNLIINIDNKLKYFFKDENDDKRKLPIKFSLKEYYVSYDYLFFKEEINKHFFLNIFNEWKTEFSSIIILGNKDCDSFFNYLKNLDVFISIKIMNLKKINSDIDKNLFIRNAQDYYLIFPENLNNNVNKFLELKKFFPTIISFININCDAIIKNILLIPKNYYDLKKLEIITHLINIYYNNTDSC